MNLEVSSPIISNFPTLDLLICKIHFKNFAIILYTPTLSSVNLNSETID